MEHSTTPALERLCCWYAIAELHGSPQRTAELDDRRRSSLLPISAPQPDVDSPVCTVHGSFRLHLAATGRSTYEAIWFATGQRLQSQSTLVLRRRPPGERSPSKGHQGGCVVHAAGAATSSYLPTGIDAHGMDSAHADPNPRSASDDQRPPTSAVPTGIPAFGILLDAPSTSSSSPSSHAYSIYST
jgi:hypothetical protein